MRMLPSSSLTVPDVQVSRFRFFMEEFCSRRCSDGRSGLPAEDAALGVQWTGSRGADSRDPAATTTFARSSRPDRRTSVIVESCQLCRSRHSGPASSRSDGLAGQGWADADWPDTKPSPPPALGRNGSLPLLVAPRSCPPATCPRCGRSRGRWTRYHPSPDG